MKNILKIHKEIHQYKTQFDVMRYPNPNTSLLMPCPVCGGKPFNPTDAVYAGSTAWKEAPGYIGTICTLIPIEADSEMLSDGSCDIDFGGVTDLFLPGNQAAIPMVGEIGVFGGAPCNCCNIDPRLKVAFSPSTENGKFIPNPVKLPGGKLDQTIITKSSQLFDYEKQLGAGGDEIKTITMNKIETIGMVMNDMQSYRIDPIGKLKIDGCWVSPQITYDTFKPSPHVEYVDVADIPGGDYILTVMNKYKLLVGARGVNIQTHGPIDIYGTIVNMAAEQLNISSKNEVVIDGGERLSLRARKLTLLPNDHNAVVVEGQLHVTRNVIIEGGIMLEGEVGLLHITAPIEWQETENGLWEVEPTCTVPALLYGEIPIVITLPPHKHYFKNLPLTLYEHNERVRTDMIDKGINARDKIAAASSTSSAGSCSDSVYYTVEQEFSNVAEGKANEAASAKEVEGTVSSGGICLKGSGRGLCVTSADGIITMTSFYKWYDKNVHTTNGIVSVKGKIRQIAGTAGEIGDYEIIEGPE